MSKDNKFIHPYEYTPDLTFYHASTESDDGPQYIGVEFEFNFESAVYRDAVVEAFRNFKCGLFYCKHDGSLDKYGCEFVSHPCTLAAWRLFMPDFKKMFNDVRQWCKVSDDTGMHMHLDRDDIPQSVRNKMNLFFALNSRELEVLARRDPWDWAAFPDLPSRGHPVRESQDRYTALNWFPDYTVEVRIFKAPESALQFYEALELCSAIKLFCMETKSRPTWANFRRWLAGENYNLLEYRVCAL